MISPASRRVLGVLILLVVAACVTDDAGNDLSIVQSAPVEALDPVPSLIADGDDAFFRGDFEKAAASFEEAHRLAWSRYEIGPDNVLTQMDLAVALDPLGRVAHALGDAAEARAHWTEMAALVEGALRSQPSDPNLRFLSGLAHMRLASLGEGDRQAELAKGVALLKGLEAEGQLGAREQQMLSLAAGALEEGAAPADGDPYVELDRYDDDAPFAAGDYDAALATSTGRLLAANALHLSGALDASEAAAENGAHAWRALFAQEYAVAEASARRGLELDPAQTWIATNLAHALMFQGRIAEADAIYHAHAGEILVAEPELTWETVIAEDFAQLHTAGFVHPHMDEVLAKLTP